MNWFTLSLLTALAVASQDAWVKRWFSNLAAHEMFLYPLIYSFPLCLASLLFVRVPPLDYVFALSFAASLPLNAVPFILYMKAIKESPLSLTVPYLAFTPVFMIPTGYLFLNELPDFWGMVGIGSVCAGSYVIHVDLRHFSLLAPFSAVFKETGSWIMLIVAFIFAFSAVLGKLAILHSSVLFFQMSFFCVLTVLLTLMYAAAGKIRLKTFIQNPLKGAVAGLLFYGQVLFHGFAISMVKAAYMISIKRLSILFGVIYGGIFFKEENIVVRFAGALLMFAGAVLILLRAR